MDAAGWRGGDDLVVGVVDCEPTDEDRESDAGAASTASTSASDSTSASTHESGDVRTAIREIRDREDVRTIERGALDDVLAADPSLVIAVGEAALSAVARARPAVPVLPVGAVPGIDSVAPDRLSAAIETVLAGEAIERERSVLALDVVDGEDAADETEGDGIEVDDRKRALFDVTLVTDEPARISEFGVRSRDDSVATFRADGVVVATPAGSYGYASAIEGPQLSAAVDAVAVAPIAPFVTQTRRWVLPDDSVTLSVERDEGDVTVVADDQAVDTVSIGAEVTVSVDGTLSMLVVPNDVLES